MQSLILSSDWSLANARACAEASQFVYDNPCSIESSLAHGMMIDCGAQSVEGNSSVARVLAWKGSASWQDWQSNFMCRRVELGEGWEIHAGIREAALSVWPQVLNRIGGSSRPLFITGHSRGAGLATEMARLLTGAGVPVMGVYTFGGLRIYNRAGARYYDALIARGQSPTANRTLGERTFRIVNQEDGVPRVPPAVPPLCALARWTRIWGYWHVGQEAFIPALGGMVMNPSLVFKLCSDLAGTMREWSQGKVAQAMDHPMSRYVEATQKL